MLDSIHMPPTIGATDSGGSTNTVAPEKLVTVRRSIAPVGSITSRNQLAPVASGGSLSIVSDAVPVTDIRPPRRAPATY